jgi:hypothetical protein
LSASWNCWRTFKNDVLAGRVVRIIDGFVCQDAVLTCNDPEMFFDQLLGCLQLPEVVEYTPISVSICLQTDTAYVFMRSSEGADGYEPQKGMNGLRPLCSSGS